LKPNLTFSGQIRMAGVLGDRSITASAKMLLGGQCINAWVAGSLTTSAYRRTFGSGKGCPVGAAAGSRPRMSKAGARFSTDRVTARCRCLGTAPGQTANTGARGYRTLCVTGV
jgi:hypothetical protein